MNFLIIIILYLLATLSLLFFGLKNFHKDDFQFLATIPYRRSENGTYQGINLTFYGLITAISCLLSTFLFISLLKIINFPEIGTYLILTLILVVGIPSSKILATIIEGRKNTLTIGGAVFISGLISLPITWLVLTYLDLSLDKFLLPIITAISISYAFGEGIGRLACLSFGCCYGKPIDSFSFLKNIDFLMVKFSCETKKAVYDGKYKEIPLLNTQALTSIVYIILAISSLLLYLFSYIKLALILSLSLTQLFRFFVEFLRDDFRGNRKVSVYQVFAIILFLYGITIASIFNVKYDIEFTKPIYYKSHDWMILFVVFILTFLNSGISKVTESNIKFLLKER
ncbi:MAG: prolipoprotein diacylglyceryl transferase [Thermodesulfovibrio sp.]|nr:prolipoprotein diacylglyceryl transferase [Thermodesulfovibrio sp.]